jgi:spore germination cell wall hydrolase CwlJ-like protein
MKSILTTILISMISFTTHNGLVVAQSYPIEFSEIEIKPKLYKVETKIKLSKHDYNCLARNIYFESGIESHVGKLAVAQITFNRLEMGRWGNSICKVVYDKHQFSWTKDKKKLFQKPKGPLWDQSILALNDYLNGTRIYNLSNSTHYHADWINTPKWALMIDPTDYIGQHIFYSIK